MKIAGIIQPGTTLGYVVESKHVKASLIVAQTIEERDKLVNEGDQALVNGTPIYVAGVHKTYIYQKENSSFIDCPLIVEDQDGVLCIKDEDGSLRKIKLNITINDLDPSLKEEIDNLPTSQEVEALLTQKLGDYVSQEYLSQFIEDEIIPKLDTKQDKLTAGEGIKIENNIISLTGVDKEIVFATKADFPYIGKENILYVAKDEKVLYIWDLESNDYVPVPEKSMSDIDVINGGNATPNL